MEGGPPPIATVPYPRQSDVQKDRLISLVEGYHGLSYAFGANILLNVVGNIAIAALNLEYGILLIVPFALVIAFFLTLGPNRKVGYGLGWKDSGPYVASALIGLNAALFCGIVGYIVVQTMASNELKRQGVKIGFLVTKKNMLQQIDAL